MPRRSAGRSSSPRPSRSYASTPNVPARAPPAQVASPQQAQPRQPGLMANMASTAAGVAIGSTVGHTIGHALFGGSGGQDVEPQQQQQQQPIASQGMANKDPFEQEGPCAREMKQLYQCAQQYDDLSLCQVFQQALKNCKAGATQSAHW